MPIPQIVKSLLSKLDEKQINENIYDYYIRFGANPKLLNDMIKAYISNILNDELDKWNPIKLNTA